MRWILASASPRRRELLRQIELPFEVFPSEADETMDETLPDRLVEELSRRKALAAAGRLRSIAWCWEPTRWWPGKRGAWKAWNRRESQGNAAYAFRTGTPGADGGDTGGDGRGSAAAAENIFEETHVSLYALTEEELEAYVRSGEPMDKAGAYGIQGKFARFVRKIDGDYNNVVGLPVARVYQEMKNMFGEEALRLC